jgi:ankyrin repeat protein
MNINKELNYLIKNHKYDEFKKRLNKDIDVNFQDEYKNTLIHYAIIFNQEEIIKLLLSYECKIDYIDIDGKSILHYPIKFGYNNILKIMLDNSKDIIGMSIYNIKDKTNNTPLHYAVLYNNSVALNVLLDIDSNINTANDEGNTPLHIAVYNNNIDNINLLLKNKDIQVNLLNNNGLSVFHIAVIKRYIDILKIFIYDKTFNINVIETKYNMTPLMYLLDINYLNIIIEMLNNGALLSYQDIYGNNILHHCLIENKLDMFIFLKNYKNNKIIDNQINIKGNTPLHILLENFNNIDIDIDLNNIIMNTNINLQDYNGNTCMHLLCKKNLWLKVKNILIKKKIDLFIYNLDNETPLSYINKENYNEFIDIITLSYYNYLKKKPQQWVSKWENECSTVKDKTKCLELIKNNIINSNSSIPLKKNIYKINIPTSDAVKYNTFLGISLDVVSCCIYIATKCNYFVTIQHEMSDNSNFNLFLSSMKLTRFYDVTDFYGIEILWIQQHIYIPSSIDKSIEMFKNSSKRLMAIPIGIELSQGSHANMLIIDKIKLIAERFEPSGKDTPIGFYYNQELLDTKLLTYLNKFFDNITYLKPTNYLPKISFQLYDNIEEDHNKNIGDPDGFCLSWCFWYASEKSKYVDMPSEQLVKKLIIAVKRQNLSFRSVIRNFTKFTTDIRDNLLEQNNIDINNWINNNVTIELINQVHDNIKKIVYDLNL